MGGWVTCVAAGKAGVARKGVGWFGWSALREVWLLLLLAWERSNPPHSAPEGSTLVLTPAPPPSQFPCFRLKMAAGGNTEEG